MKVFAVDPGGTTGFVASDGWDNILLVGQSKYFADVRTGIKEVQPDLVVYESFSLFAHKALQQTGSDMPSATIIGRLIEVCEALGIPMKAQTPGSRKIISNEILFASGWHAATKGLPHARDAAMHLLTYYKNNGHAAELYKLLEDKK